MNLVDFLHLDELARLGVSLYLKNEVVQAGSCHACHGTFRSGHGQREPDEQCRHHNEDDGNNDQGGTGILHNGFWCPCVLFPGIEVTALAVRGIVKSQRIGSARWKSGLHVCIASQGKKGQ